MGDNQPPSGIAPQMPLDLSVYDNHKDYMTASQCNYILQCALKKKDGIATQANINITKMIEDMYHKVLKELTDAEKFQEDEMSKAIKELISLGHSQHEIYSAEAYLFHRPCPDASSHSQLKSSLEAFRDLTKPYLKISSEPYAKPVRDNSVAPSPAHRISTPSLFSAHGQQPKPPFPALLAILPRLRNPFTVNASTSATYAASNPAKALSTTSAIDWPGQRKAAPQFNPFLAPEREPETENLFAKLPGRPVVKLPSKLAETPAVEAPTVTSDTKKRSFSEKDDSEVKQENKRPRIECAPSHSKTICLRDLKRGDRPIMIDGSFHVLRCPDRFFRIGRGNGVNPVEYPRDFIFNVMEGKAFLHGTHFTMRTVMEHLALRVVNDKGVNVQYQTLETAGFHPEFSSM